MKRIYVIFIILLFFSLVYCADRIPILIDDFSPGLNTVSRGFTGRLGEGTVVHNFDLWAHPGDLTVRDGYDSVFAIPGIDSFLYNGLHAINFVDGTKKLAIVGDSIGVGYANVYTTGNSNVIFGTIDSFFFIPDTAFTSLIYSYNPDIVIWQPYIRYKISSDDSVYIDSFIQDSSTFYDYGLFADSMVASINANFSAWATASKITGDTLLVIQDSVTKPITIISFYGTFRIDVPPPDLDTFYNATRFTLTRESGYITSSTSTNRIATRFPATGQLWWTQFKGVTYLGTGTSKAISYDGKTVNKFPMRAPGEPDIIPLTTPGRLDGIYRYAMIYGSPSDSVSDTLKSTTIGYLSTPISVDSQQIMLFDFPLPNVDYYYGGEDTVTIEIWRTVGDIGRLDRADSIWFTGIEITMADSAAYANTVIIDTMSDSLIRANGASIIISDGDFHSWQSGDISAPDSIIHKYTSKPGAPSIISWGSANGNGGIWTEDSASTADTISWLNAAGYSYMCVFVDTNLNSPSDSGRSFNFFQGGNVRNESPNIAGSYNDSTILVIGVDTINLGFSRKNTEKITIALPRVTGGTNQILLYRGAVVPFQYDTSSFKNRQTSSGGIIVKELVDPFEIQVSDSFFVPFYYLIGAYNPADTVVDSLDYNSLLARETYKRNAIPPLIKQMVTVDNQLLATDGQYLYESEPTADSVAFNIFSKSPVNIDDGDEITTIIVKRGVVDLLKNNSKYRLTRDANGFWRVIEISKNYGSVSALSHASAPEGDYFLSTDGVRLEDENIYREKSNIGSLISGQLDNFTNMSLALQKSCYADYIDGKYLISFPSLDTTYVSNKVRLPNGQNIYSWTTWDGVVMIGSAKYAVRKDNIVYPGDTLYFIKSGSNGIYRYGTSGKDNGEDIKYIWRSPQLTSIFDGYKQISKCYIEVESTDTVDASHSILFFDERFTSPVTENQVVFSRLDTSYVYAYNSPTADVNKSWILFLVKSTNTTGFASGGADPTTIFKQIYIEMIRRGNLPTR